MIAPAQLGAFADVLRDVHRVTMDSASMWTECRAGLVGMDEFAAKIAELQSLLDQLYRAGAVDARILPMLTGTALAIDVALGASPARLFTNSRRLAELAHNGPLPPRRGFIDPAAPWNALHDWALRRLPYTMDEVMGAASESLTPPKVH